MNPNYFVSWLFLRSFFRLGMSVKYSGREHIPPSGGFLIATNHRSYYDPLIVGASQKKKTYYLAKEELFRNPLIGAWLRSVGSLSIKRGKIDREALKVCVRTINSGQRLLIFPEGTRSRTDEFLSAKPGLGMIAIEAGCPILPGYIYGSNMMWDCVLRKRGLSLTFGPPLSAEWIASQEPGREGYRAIVRETMARIELLRDNCISVKKVRPDSEEISGSA